MSALSALFYFSNWWQIAATGNYFVATGAGLPLTHTWSLAVEEQFYLVWPLVVLAVMHLSRTFARGIRVLLVAVGAGRCRARPSRWPCSTARWPTPPGSTSAPTPMPSPSWSARCWPVP